MIELHHSITYVKTFADRLRYVREKRRMTQAELARACGISQGAIANYEAQTRSTPRAIFTLANVLKVNAQWLYDGSGPIEPQPAPISQTVYQLKEHGRQTTVGLWPFESLSPNQWWQLSKKEQQLIEAVVASLIKNLR